MISFKKVTFSYGNAPVLSSIDFSVPDGKIWALIGRSGVGKTTLLNIAAGLFAPTIGTVEVGGKAVYGPGLIKGVVFQDETLLGWKSSLENLLFSFQELSPPDSDEAMELFKTVGLSGSEELYPHQLSAGMRKRLEFARAVLSDKEYLLADEPFGTLDALTRRELWEVWGKFRQHSSRTGILCTHDPLEAAALCDAIIPLKKLQSGGATMGAPIEVPNTLKEGLFNQFSPEIEEFSKQVIAELDDYA